MRRFTAKEAARIAKRLHAQVPARELARGMNVELEHGRRDRRTDVTHDDPTKTAKIALAHLYERPDYYDRLAEAKLNPSIRYASNYYGYSHGQHDAVVRAFDGDKVVGELWFSVFRGVPLIKMVEVDPAYRRTGVGKGLVRQLSKEHPYGSVDWGYMTDDGIRLRRAMDREYGKTRYRVRGRPRPTKRTAAEWEARGYPPEYLESLRRPRHNPGMRHLSHGFYQISPAQAGRLARGVGKKLPKHGYELRVQLPDGRLAWLTRTPHQGKSVWAVSGISGAARSNPSYALENPPHYSRRGRVVTFDNGHRYVINEATVRQAAQYLAGPVKRAEHAGRRPPVGPHGLTPGAAAVLIHFGRKLLKKRPARKAAPKRRAPARRAPARRASTPRPAPRPAPTPRRAPVDFWDREAEIYGG